MTAPRSLVSMLPFLRDFPPTVMRVACRQRLIPSRRYGALVRPTDRPHLPMRTLSLNQKLASMIVILWLGLLVIAGIGAWQTRASMITDRRDQLASLVAQATSVTDHYYKLSQQNALPEADAKQKALEAI